MSRLFCFEGEACLLFSLADQHHISAVATPRDDKLFAVAGEIKGPDAFGTGLVEIGHFSTSRRKSASSAQAAAIEFKKMIFYEATPSSTKKRSDRIDKMNRMLIGTVRRAVASWWHGLPVTTARGTVPMIAISSILSILSKTLREPSCGLVEEKSFS